MSIGKLSGSDSLAATSNAANAANAIDGRDLQTLKMAARQGSPQALKAAAQQFEAMFMNMMMKSMREATPQDSMFDNQQSRMYTAMLDQKLSENFARRGMGLADALTRQLGNNAAGAVDPLVLPAGANAPSKMQPASPAAKPLAHGMPANVPTNPPTSAPANKHANAPANATANANATAPKAPSTLPDYVRAFRDKLSEHAQQASRVTGIPARFMLGQAALESGWGRREISAANGSTTHNIFGIKASPGWKGQVVEVPTTEYVNGVAQKRLEKFRSYGSYAEAFQDYARMLSGNARYKDVIANAQDVHGFAQGLQRAGYATDPAYADKLTRLISQKLA